jgi:hypothetical protein
MRIVRKIPKATGLKVIDRKVIAAKISLLSPANGKTFGAKGNRIPLNRPRVKQGKAKPAKRAVISVRTGRALISAETGKAARISAETDKAGRISAETDKAGRQDKAALISEGMGRRAKPAHIHEGMVSRDKAARISAETAKAEQQGKAALISAGMALPEHINATLDRADQVARISAKTRREDLLRRMRAVHLIRGATRNPRAL